MWLSTEREQQLQHVCQQQCSQCSGRDDSAVSPWLPLTVMAVHVQYVLRRTVLYIPLRKRPIMSDQWLTTECMPAAGRASTAIVVPASCQAAELLTVTALLSPVSWPYAAVITTAVWYLAIAVSRRQILTSFVSHSWHYIQWYGSWYVIHNYNTYYQLFYLHLVGYIRLTLNLNNSIVMKTNHMYACCLCRYNAGEWHDWHCRPANKLSDRRQNAWLWKEDDLCQFHWRSVGYSDRDIL